MGRSEVLTALALGRGHYDDEVVWNSEADEANSQRYNSRGHPKNPETKKREKDHIRAANEVMQVTGVVEDAAAARAKSSLDEADKQLESFIGFRLIDFCRTCLHTGVWPILGLRRRILLHRSYTSMNIFDIIRQERQTRSMYQILFTGLPMALIPHTSDYVVLIIEALLDYIHGSDASGYSLFSLNTNLLAQRSIELLYSFFKLQFTLFSTLQQLGLISKPIVFPGLMSLVPFTPSSLIQFKLKPQATYWLGCTSLIRAALQTVVPLLVIRGYERIQLAVSSIIYRQIYNGLPRPTGTDLLSGLPLGSPNVDNDTTDHIIASTWNSLPSTSWIAMSNDSESPQNVGHYGSDVDDDEMNHAQLISFDVEPTESSDASRGPWSAELRSTNEPKTPSVARYRVTGLTLLPNILATEGLTDAVCDILVLPFEAIMVRVIGAAYQYNSDVKSNYYFGIGLKPRGIVNLIITWTWQVTITGIIWAGFTLCTNWYTIKKQKKG
ncbi:hypothetical protein OnM2_063056 [Erysiphe neolycopersici]|uniref:Uncharacterized protein n=1 Tax=Erysiphe neolycopersici TaxID=212602 RepID=A0A420HNU1_9PEZI|nr:hypothetical protein OnM2_063056 [Erysiphe neolycopersici]